MNYVTLGKTGLKAAVVSFGGIPIQRADGANTKAVVDKLEEYGINYIDTARGYTVSEEYLGAALEGRRDKFILATKSMSRDAASMAADVETSLRNLRTGYIDLYQLHNLPEKDIEKVFGPGGAYEALTAAREAGRSATSASPPTALMRLKFWWRTTPTALKPLCSPIILWRIRGGTCWPWPGRRASAPSP